MESQDEDTLISALQPWCDGEGCVRVPPFGHRPLFSLTQSRHTDIDFNAVPYAPRDGRCDRTFSVGDLRHMTILGMSALDYLALGCRSEIFDDVMTLFHKLGFKPKNRVQCIHLKDDGFWSVLWIICFSAFETEKLVSMGLITQGRKKCRASITPHAY